MLVKEIKKQGKFNKSKMTYNMEKYIIFQTKEGYTSYWVHTQEKHPQYDQRCWIGDDITLDEAIQTIEEYHKDIVTKIYF